MIKIQGNAIIKSAVFNNISQLNNFYAAAPGQILDVQMQYHHHHQQMQYMVTFQEIQAPGGRIETKHWDLPFADLQTPDEYADVPENECLACGEHLDAGQNVIGVEDGHVCNDDCLLRYAKKKLAAVDVKFEGVNVDE